jgi:hypothetical protein
MDIMEVDFNKLIAMVDELDAIDVAVSDEVKVMALFISLLEMSRSQVPCRPT